MFTSKFKKASLIAGSIFIISIFAYILGWSSLLTVKSIEVSGTQSSNAITNELMAKDLTLTVGMQLARVDIRGIKSTLSNMDWLGNYSVSRNWFSRKISLTVEEKTGIAKAIDTGGSILYFDKEGQLFKPISAIQLGAMNNLPLVQTQSNAKSDLAEVAKLLQLLPADLTDLVSNLNGISVANSGFISMGTKSGGRSIEIIWGRADAIAQKSKVLLALLDLPENKAATKFDLSLPDSPIVS